MAKTYRPPEEAKSPQDVLELDRVLFDGGENDVSIARGTWGSQTCLLIRWNGEEYRENGFPSRGGYMQWMVVPEWMHVGILEALNGRIASDISGGVRDIPGR